MCCAHLALAFRLMLHSSSCASCFYTARPVLRRAALLHHDPEGRESLCPRLNVCARRVTFIRFLLSACRPFNLLSLRLFVISGFVLFIWKKNAGKWVFSVGFGANRASCICFVATGSSNIKWIGSRRFSTKDSSTHRQELMRPPV